MREVCFQRKTGKLFIRSPEAYLRTTNKNIDSVFHSLVRAKIAFHKSNRLDAHVEVFVAMRKCAYGEHIKHMYQFPRFS